MKRKRGPGGGRKPKGEFSQLTSSLTIRIPHDMRKQLESEAAINGHSVAQTLLWHLRQSFNRERDRERDPALDGLLFMIARLAVYTSRAVYESDKVSRSLKQARWRNDLFTFRAFKVAVAKLLEALKEPPGPVTLLTKEKILEMVKDQLSPEVIEQVVEKFGSPEALGAFAFEIIWREAEITGPLSANVREMLRKEGYLGAVLEHELYALPKARKALELKPETTKPKDESR
jgi:hypothetical protein